jgi:hypothetical protein
MKHGQPHWVKEATAEDDMRPLADTSEEPQRRPSESPEAVKVGKRMKAASPDVDPKTLQGGCREGSLAEDRAPGQQVSLDVRILGPEDLQANHFENFPPNLPAQEYRRPPPDPSPRPDFASNSDGPFSPAPEFSAEPVAPGQAYGRFAGYASGPCSKTFLTLRATEAPPSYSLYQGAPANGSRRLLRDEPLRGLGGDGSDDVRHYSRLLTVPRIPDSPSLKFSVEESLKVERLLQLDQESRITLKESR